MIDKWLVVHSLCVASLEKQYSCCCFAWNHISSTLVVVSDGPGRRFSGLTCGLRLQTPIWWAAVARWCCFINHFLLPVKSQRTVFAFITEHWWPDAVNWTAAFVTGPALCTVNNPNTHSKWSITALSWSRDPKHMLSICTIPASSWHNKTWLSSTKLCKLYWEA